MATMDYNAPQNVSGEIVSELFKKGNKTALFSDFVAKIRHVDTKIVRGFLRIQGWIPLSSFVNEYPKGESIDMSFSVNETTIKGYAVTVVEIWCWTVPLWYFHKEEESAFEVAHKIPHDVLTENDFKL